MTHPSLRHAIHFSVLFCLVGSCSNTPPAPDAGTSSAAIGAACSKDAECGADEQCDTTLMDGYCTMQCSGATACPGNAICGTIFGAAGCEQACSSAADCTRTGYTCDPTTGGCLPACNADNDCGAGQYCNASGQCVTGCDQDSDCNGEWYCNTGTNLCTPGCDQDSQCASGSCVTSTNQCATVVPDAGTDGGIIDGGSSDAGANDAGATDAGATDAGASDAGGADAGAGSDGGGCSGYAEPSQTAACKCESKDGGCAANNCYGGYYCDLSDDKCVTPPSSCGTTDAGGSEDAGSECPGYAEPSQTAACKCESKDGGCAANNCYGGYYCDLSDNRCVTPPASCATIDAGIFEDAGGACPGYAEPSESANCTCEATDGGCAANNCYGGYYCDLSDTRCVEPPAGCAEDAGVSDGGLCAGYAAPSQTADCTCDSSEHTCNPNGCYGTYYCDLSDNRCVMPPSGC